MRVVGTLLLLLVTATGCATPPEIKQALIAKDQAYANNARLMEIHRGLLVNIDTRYWYWYRYAKKLALLNAALKWTTTNPLPPSEANDEAFLSIYLRELIAKETAGNEPTSKEIFDSAKSDPLIRLINKLRLNGLPERKSGDGTVAFAAGHGDMKRLLQAIPELIDVIQKKIDAEFKEANKATNYQPFDEYQTNLAGLRRINAIVEQYLDIDVTVKSEDLKQLVDTAKQLR
ncbi:MAG: hypothetical protein AB7G68_14275 [Nitrospiraceae bacterium]